MTYPNTAVASPLLRFHRLRDSLFNELHTRPFPLIESPAKVCQFAVLHAENAKSAELGHINVLCTRYSVNPPAMDSNCYYQNFGGFEFRWELHTEFSTYTIIQQSQGAEPFRRSAMELLPAEWLSAIPGEIINGLNLEVLPAPKAEVTTEELNQFFEGHRQLSCYARDKKAHIWTAYRIHSDGLGRFLIYNLKLNPCQTGRTVRRVLELETYRMMALLAFPVARQIAPEITAMDQQVAAIVQQITDIKDLEDERSLLTELSALSARVGQIVSDTNYRFSATEAYYDIVMNRLEEMREKEVAGHQTLKEFLSRRFIPAYRTCKAVEADLEQLSERIDQASELLRTRVNLTIEAQNQDLLQSMNRRSEIQLHLQQAVEGLSVAAISYYLVGLVKYLAESARSFGMDLNATLVTGVSVPVAVLAVWFGLRRLKRKLKQVSTY